MNKLIKDIKYLLENKNKPLEVTYNKYYVEFTGQEKAKEYMNVYCRVPRFITWLINA